MSVTTPIILMAFANQADAHLDLLKKESEAIKNALREHEKRQFLRLEREESATNEKLTATLAAYPDEVVIFHYAGHASGQKLELEGGDAQASGLAKLLGVQKNLQLVFLNGCSTLAQVEALHEAGVPAVIATSVPIEDPMALDFAKLFYTALANKRSIGGAFAFAKAGVETKAPSATLGGLGSTTLGGLGSGLGLTTLEALRSGRDEVATQEHPEALPWVLSLKDDTSRAALDYHLPYYRQDFGLPDTMLQLIDRRFQLNRYIVRVLDEMCRYNPDIYTQMVEVEDGKEVPKDPSTYIDLVIKNFPWPIGSQLQLIRQFSQPDLRRLEQLLSTYIISGRVLYYILMSNLWEEKRARDIKLPANFRQQHRIGAEQVLSYDYLGGAAQLYDILIAAERQPALRELPAFFAQLKDANNHLAQAKNYLEQLRASYTATEATALESTCTTAEQALAVVLMQLAFLADYRMLTVRDINLDNPRFQPIAYQLDFGRLNAIVNTSLSLYEDAERRRKSSFSSAKSILLAPSEQDPSQSLNLAPFFIDKNTFLRNPHIDLFMYGYEQDGKHHYLAVKHSIFIAMKNERGTDIIHTGMTEADFKEGRNITTQASTPSFGFDTAFAPAVATGPPILAMPEQLLQQYKGDLEL